jgi:hypothetical protein
MSLEQLQAWVQRSMDMAGCESAGQLSPQGQEH